MDLLNKETEALLKECVENSSEFPGLLATKLEGLSSTENSRLRGQIKDLVDKGYFSEILWADNIPWVGTITEKGYDYFQNKDTILSRSTKNEQNTPKMHNQKTNNRKIVFTGILGYDCGEVEEYDGADKQKKEKGFVVHYGIPTLRGFARMSDLAKASKAKYEEYQREMNQNHVNEIERFLSECKAEAKFLPEVVLSVNSPEKATLRRYSHKAFSGANATLRGAIDNMDFYTLEVEEGALARVDGNHRLEAGKDKGYYVPFSIIVWGINQENEENKLLGGSTRDNTESEAFLFYVLNNTAKRLEAEENFKGLVRSETWTADELAIINRHLPILKYFDQKYSGNPLLDKDFMPFPLSQICEILTEIDDLDLGSKEFDTLFVDAIKLIGQSEYFSYSRKHFPKILFQLAFYTRYRCDSFQEAVMKLKLVDKWLEKYNYTGDVFSKASKVFDVAHKFISSSPKYIFMAMEFKSEQAVADYNGALSRAVHALNNMGGNIYVEAYPIMTGKGKSFCITSDIYRKIEECAIFIADTTEANPNVMYELGIAFNKKKPIIMVREKGKRIKVPSDIISDYYYAFSGMTELEKLFVTHIKEILQSDYGAVFSD